MTKPIRLKLGRCVVTPGAADALAAAGLDPNALLARHAAGDWGDVCEVDRAANDEDAVYGGRVLSAYKIGPGVKVWVLTEQDRSATTCLLPEEY